MHYAQFFSMAPHQAWQALEKEIEELIARDSYMDQYEMACEEIARFYSGIL